MKNILISLVLLIAFFCDVHAQEPQLASLLEMAEKSSQKYVEVFKNLIAEETKTVETFKKDQRLDNRRVIKSNFIVYQLQKTNSVSEFRTVLEYNNRKISQKDEDVVKFFEKLAKSGNAEEEFRKVKNESIRYDGNFIVWGMTLRKDFLLQAKVRKIFDYKIVGREILGGRNVYVVEYHQKEYSPYILANPTRGERGDSGFQFDTIISDKLRPTNPRMNGRMWLDAENGELWKNQYQVTIQPNLLTKPIVTNKSSYEYQPSKFNVGVPKVISITSYRVSGDSEKNLFVSKLATTTLSYSNFSQLDSEAKDYKMDSRKN